MESFRQAVRQINPIKPGFAVICGDLVNTASGNSDDGFDVNFVTPNTAWFRDNSATNNTGDGYEYTGTPQAGGNNTGYGNGSNNTCP